MIISPNLKSLIDSLGINQALNGFKYLGLVETNTRPNIFFHQIEI